jgi:hypothetical protein
MNRFHYANEHSPRWSRREFLVLVLAFSFGMIALAVLAYGLILLQDDLTGLVPDSHSTAWARTAPLAGIFSGIGLLTGLWFATCRGQSGRVIAVVAVNSVALGGVIMTAP